MRGRAWGCRRSGAAQDLNNLSASPLSRTHLLPYSASQPQDWPLSQLCKGKNLVDSVPRELGQREGSSFLPRSAGVWKEEGRLERAGGVAPELEHLSAVHTGRWPFN